MIASILMTLPEEILGTAALLLMLVAAWGGTGATRLISWTSVAVLIGAGIALFGAASSGGDAYDGLYHADAFAAFAKVLIYVAAGVSILLAPNFFRRSAGDDLRPEYPVLILLSAAGMGMMVSAGDLLTLYVGLELQSLAAYVLASYNRRAAPSAEAMAMAVRVAGEAMGPATDQWRQIVIFASLASIIFGAVAAIGQSNIKRLLAYSSINNVGFALVGLAAGTPEGVSSVLVYMTIYIVMTLGSFLVVLQMRDADGQPVETIASLAGLSRTRPALAWAFLAFMFSLAGIPPLFGFYAKLAVFNAAVAAGLYPYAVAGIAGAVIGAYYYIRIVKTMFFEEPAGEYGPSEDRVEGGLIAVAAVAISPLGYLAIPLLTAWGMAAAKALFCASRG